MANRLLETTIGEVCQVFDGPHATPTRLDAGPVFLGITSLNKGRIDLAASDHVSEEDFSKWTRRVTPKPGDVVFSYETKLGEAAIIPEGLRCCLGRRMGLMRPDPNKLDSRFLLYYYLGPEFQDVIRERTIRGSTVERIALIEFPRFPLRIPPLHQQRAIARALGALDDKIELNRRMNATLEAMARALFQSWFVDFDPVRAKLAGHEPVGMDQATAALFPEQFEESALGHAPKGWHIKRVSDVVEEVFDGPHATPPDAEAGPVFLGIKNLTGSGLDLSDVRHISDSDWPRWTKRVTPRPLDIVFSYEATLGFFALIPPGLRCCLGRRLALIRPKAREGHPHFWLHQFIGPDFQRYLMKHSVQGATVDRIPLIHFPNYLVLAPPLPLTQAFESRVAPLWATIHANAEQSGILATLRDTLLPKLLGGELSVAEAAATG